MANSSTNSAGNPTTPLRVIFFDGTCHVCNTSVRFVLRHEASPFFQFAPLQSSTAARLLAPFAIPPDYRDSVIVLEDGTVSFASDAALRIAAHLRRPWRWLTLLRIFPHAWRDAFYRAFARQRYRLFGKDETCALPRPEWRTRFLAEE